MLIDLILARGGWERVSDLGGAMRDADLIVQQPVTGERAFVQVKSAATQSVLDDCIKRFRGYSGYPRMIFACHKPAGVLSTDRADVMIWTGRGLAQAASRNGLFDWLIDRVG